MDDRAQALAFHESGATLLRSIYHFNALATSRLVPHAATVVDLGSGSAQYLVYLSQRRPDLRIIGIELAPTMVEIGRACIERAGLKMRVQMRLGDMTDFIHELPSSVDLVSSIFSLHHLPTSNELARCLHQISLTKKRYESAVWIFDHARPRHHSTATNFVSLFSPTAPIEFRKDSHNSLLASFSFDELGDQIISAGMKGGLHRLAKWLPLYQIHAWNSSRRPASEELFERIALGRNIRKELKGLHLLFPDIMDQIVV